MEDRVYVDEAGVDDTLDYAYGWSLKGTRCVGERLGHRTQRGASHAARLDGSRLVSGAGFSAAEFRRLL